MVEACSVYVSMRISCAHAFTVIGAINFHALNSSYNISGVPDLISNFVLVSIIIII